MGIISWIIIGGLAGWIASMVMKTDAQMGVFMNIIVGIVGAMLGGWLMGMLFGIDLAGFSLQSLFGAFVGSVILLALLKLFTGMSSQAHTHA